MLSKVEEYILMRPTWEPPLRLTAILSLPGMLVSESVFTPHNLFGSTLALEATLLVLDPSLQGPIILNAHRELGKFRIAPRFTDLSFLAVWDYPLFSQQI